MSANINKSHEWVGFRDNFDSIINTSLSDAFPFKSKI